jgi:hypothetical protein
MDANLRSPEDRFSLHSSVDRFFGIADGGQIAAGNFRGSEDKPGLDIAHDLGHGTGSGLSVRTVCVQCRWDVLGRVMLTFKIPSRLGVWLAAKYCWMADEPTIGDAVGFTQHFHCHDTREHSGFQREVKFTKIVDLRPPAETVFDQFSRHTRRKIKQGSNQGFQFEPNVPEVELIEIYSRFARDNNLPELEKRVLNAYWPDMKVTKLSYNCRTLVMHSLMIDEAKGRACMLHDASMFRQMPDQRHRNLIGHANRYLHFLDMMYLKDRGIESLDLGGYAKDTEDEHLRHINEFKDGFGGELVEMSNYVSHPLSCYRKLSSCLRGQGELVSAVDAEDVGDGKKELNPQIQ